MKEIKLKRGEVALVDDEDFDRLVQLKWHCGSGGYAVHRVWPSGLILMHRFILNSPKGMVTDHIDRNRLNNQKNNLRVCHQTNNARNRNPDRGHSSLFKGVSIHSTRGYKYYRASLKINGNDFIEFFPFTKEGELDAARAYDRLALEHFKEYAYLNFNQEK